ncbi:MAG TPA: hypothetical protein VNA65_07930 [Candidatus Dormibacteraeota bacterium]|nr:hypothetical protein [Candidatus Dormibacteraeota bacterium]
MRGLKLALLAAGVLALVNGMIVSQASSGPFVAKFNSVQTVASTVPKNGDVNPYGLVVVPTSSSRLTAGNALVSNFNGRRNLQGTGSTIVQVSPSGSVSLFASLDPNKLPGSCPGGVGLTTALAVLRSGWVIVGSLPTKDGTSATMQAGCLIVIDHNGAPVETISGGPINGPWDMTALDNGSSATLFVTNVLNGTVAAGPNIVNGGTVVRIQLSLDGAVPSVASENVIGTGFAERTDPSALVVGPTGVGLARDGTLYVNDSVNSRIVSIPNAIARSGPTSGSLVSAGMNLNDPLGMAIAPNGDILTVNGGDGNLVETTPSGSQVAVKMLDTSPAPPGPNGNGTLFGVAVNAAKNGVLFVDDGTNTLNVLQ